MTKLRKVFKWGLLVAGSLLLLVLLAVIGYFAVIGARQSQQYGKALKLVEQGQLQQAELLFRRILEKDRNNENALVQLANISEARQRWHHAAVYWHILSGLNRLNPDYAKKEITTLLRSRDFHTAIYVIEHLSPTAQKEYQVELSFAKLQTGKPAEAKKLFENSTAKTPLADYLRSLFANQGQKRDWEALANSPDLIVATDAMLQHFLQYRKNNQLPEAKAIVQALVERNPEIGAPIAGDFFYLEQNQLDQAREMYASATQYLLSLSHAIRYAEVLFLLKQSDELKKVAAKYRQGNKEILLAGLYMDLLQAFLADVPEQLAQSISALKGAAIPPLGQSILLDYGIAHDDLDIIFRALQGMKESGLLPQAAATITERVKPLLLAQYNANNVMSVYPVAELLLSKHNPDLLLVRIAVMAKNANGKLTQAELASVIRQFPGDPLLLNIATGHAIANGNYQEALRLTSQLPNDAPALRDLMFLKIVALEGLGNIEDAVKEYRVLMAKFPVDNGLGKQFLAFAMRHGREDLLEEFTAYPALSPLVQAEKNYRQNSIDQAKTLWNAERIATLLNGAELDDRPLLFQIAARLAEIGESARAIALYEKLLEYMPDNPLIYINLSELYAITDQTATAMTMAQKANLKYPDVPEVQLCYGLRMFEAKNYHSALNQLESLTKDPRAKQAVITSMTELAKEYFSQKQDQLSEEMCQRLLRLDQGNATANAYLKNIAERRKKQR